MRVLGMDDARQWTDLVGIVRRSRWGTCDLIDFPIRGERASVGQRMRCDANVFWSVHNESERDSRTTSRHLLAAKDGYLVP